MSIEKLVDILVDGIDFREKYLESIPQDLQAVVFDNNYSNNLEDTLTNSLYTLLPEPVVDDILWFLYDWQVGFKITLAEGKTYVINSKKDFITYLKDRYAE